LVLVETWHICSNDLPLRRAAPAGYSIIDAPRPGFDINRGVNYGGIAIIYSDTYVVRVIDTRLLTTSFELLACHLVAASSKLVLVTVYRPSSHAVTEIFFEEFTSLLELLSTFSSNVVIVGDFNIHVDDVTDAMALRFLDLLDAFGYMQHIKGGDTQLWSYS
jgi:exonuclease III